MQIWSGNIKKKKDDGKKKKRTVKPVIRARVSEVSNLAHLTFSNLINFSRDFI